MKVTGIFMQVTVVRNPRLFFDYVLLNYDSQVLNWKRSFRDRMLRII